MNLLSEITADDLKYFSEFQRITTIHPSDCIPTDVCFIFLVENRGELYKCIGKDKFILNKLVQVFRKPIFVFVGSNDLDSQLKNLFYNLSQFDSKIQERVDGSKQLTLIVKESERGYAIGKAGIKIKGIKELLKRNFNIANFQLRTTKEFRDPEQV